MVHEDLRLAALKGHGILDTPDHPAFDAVTKAAELAFDVPIALISLVDRKRQWFKSCIGLDVRETARDISFCTHAIGQLDVFVVRDAASDEDFKHNPLVTAEPHIRFYAGAPLIDPEGFALGTLCIIDREPRKFTARDAELLQALGQCAMTAITVHSQGELLKRADRLLRSRPRASVLVEEETILG